MDIYNLPEGFYNHFPRLNRRPKPFKITSPEDVQYNCIAWALGTFDRFWWPKNPQTFWPLGCPDEVTIPAFKALFATFGYKPCDDGRLESRYEKIALYAKGNVPTHAARQIENGRWSSKCGKSVDIEHKAKDLEGPQYGEVVMYFRRSKQKD